ncbi:MAG TPA: TlpA disulfide reductase family protein [Acidimicrobiia bacterium]|nr:TlpA disulfide reductase family protein [Acidimicrobiia bacterium]
MNRTSIGLAILALVAAACTGGSAAQITGDALEPITVEEFVAELEASTQPTVVNLWASWCIPCRSEAPLLVAAHAAFGDDVSFLGIATEDALSDSVAFIEEFGLTFENRADRVGAIRAHLSAIGMPVTVFVHPGGEILRTHHGVIDDAALALGIDDLLAEG